MKKEIGYNASSKLIMALPEGFKNGTIKRRNNHRPAWELIGNTLPNLQIWFILGNESKGPEKLNWNEFGK